MAGFKRDISKRHEVGIVTFLRPEPRSCHSVILIYVLSVKAVIPTSPIQGEGTPTPPLGRKVSKNLWPALIFHKH